MKNRSSVKELSQGKDSNFEPIRATLLLSDWPIFSHERTEGVLSPITPYFDIEIEYMNF